MSTSKTSVISSQWCAGSLLVVGIFLLISNIIMELPRYHMVFWIALILIGLGFILLVRYRIKLLLFINSLRNAINEGMQGDHYSSLHPVTDIAETTLLIEDIESVIHSLKSINDMVGNVSTSLSIHAHDLSRKSTSVSEQMQQQSVKTDMTHTSVEALAGVFTTALRTAEQTVEVANKSEQEGESGKLVMTQAMSTVSSLSESVVETGGMIESLVSESEEIGGIIYVIKSVAEQTNLLALNAAIEAARAGEQGRGFAVVADEVRSLAGKTQQYAGEIETIIDRLMDRINAVTSKVKESVDLANESDDLIENVVMSYSEIVGYMLEVSALGKQLANITKHEKNASDNVFQMLDEIKSISKATCDKLEFMQSSSAELGSLGHQLGVITNTVASSTEMDSEIDLF